MTTAMIPILNHTTLPGTSGNAFFEPYPILATNDTWKHLVGILNDTATRIGFYGAFTVPSNYDPSGTTKIIIVWTSTATAGDVEWDFDYIAVSGNDAESLDQAAAVESVNGNDTAPGAAHRRLQFEIALTAANIAAEDTVEWLLARDGTDGGDTMAAAAILFDLLFEYTIL